MAEKTISKVVYGGKTLIDLTSDTVTADKLLSGVTAHDKSGAAITGACTFGVVKYIGKASDVAITSAGLLLNIMMLKDARGNVTSIVQASKLS